MAPTGETLVKSGARRARWSKEAPSLGFASRDLLVRSRRRRILWRARRRILALRGDAGLSGVQCEDTSRQPR